MQPWLIYFVERLKPLLSLPVIVGIALSCLFLGERGITFYSLYVSCVSLFYLFFLFRLRNDLFDYNKDCIAFPDRPLPRGLLSRKEVAITVRYLQYGLLFFFVLIFFSFGAMARLLLLPVSAYVWLLLKNFYTESWMRSHPMARGFSQHAFLLPLTLLLLSFSGGDVFTLNGFSYAILLFAAFFAFDICRKLDPYSHPITLAYVHYYGFRLTYWLALGLLLLFAVGAYGLGLKMWLWPCAVVVAITLSILFKWPKRFHLAQLSGTLLLVAAAWAGVLQHFYP